MDGDVTTQIITTFLYPLLLYLMNQIRALSKKVHCLDGKVQVILTLMSKDDREKK